MSAMSRIRRCLLVLLLAPPFLLPRAEAAVDVGDPLPTVEIRLIDGSTLFPMQLRGKVVLTVFWATWCPICLRELPDYQLLHDKYQAAGLEVVALSVDEDPAEVAEYLRRSGLSVSVGMRTPELKSAWGPVQGTPLLLLSGRDGIVRVRHLGAPTLDALEREIALLLEDTSSSR